MHALCGTVGTFIMLHLRLDGSSAGGKQHQEKEKEKEKADWTQDSKDSKQQQHQLPSPVPSLTLRETAVVLLFSMLYTVNIVVSNASLKLVTVPFHQVVRGSTPLFTIALSAIFFKKMSSRAKLLSLVPVIAGVGLATYGDYYFTLFGFLLTLLGTLLAALKTVVTNLFLRSSPSPPTLSSSNQKNDDDVFLSSKHRKVPSIFKLYSPPRMSQRFKLSLTPMQLLYLMSPLAFIQTTLLAHFTGELADVNRHLSSTAPNHVYQHAQLVPGLVPWVLGWLGGPSWWLLLNGVMAFGLNVVSFYANKRIGPVGMSVAANVKQVLTVLCAVVLFDLTITGANGLGILLTLVGGAWYAHLEVKEKAVERNLKKEAKRSG
ncbi:hypothetical protein H1R20_g3774, partial [Candolleomyces eurysporus]